MTSGVETYGYDCRWCANALIRLGLCVALLAPAVGGVFCAEPFGSTKKQELSFYFGVKGYEPNSWFGEPSALALDERSGLIYVADQKAGVVNAFSTQGVAKFQYGTKNGLKAPVGLAVDKLGNVYVSENEGGPIKIINSRADISTLELPSDEKQGREAPKPGRMTFDRDGNLCVVDRANCQVIVFDKDRKFKFRFGGIGDKRGEFKLLQDVAVDRQGRFYTADSVGIPVQVFDRSGGYVSGIGRRGEASQDLSFATGIFVDRNDQVWVVDKIQHCLKVFDRSGMFLRSFGTYGQGEGSLFYPVAATADSLGRVYVLEAGARRLQVFSLSQPFEPLSPAGR